jgi:hypothetical protein
MSITMLGCTMLGCTMLGCTMLGCGGDEMATPADAGIDARDPVAFCAPNPCELLSDDFTATSIVTERWRVTTEGGATVTQSGGVLTIHLPAVAGAWADVVSVDSFPVDTTFEASVTFSAGQPYDHKAVGFSSARVGPGCDAGETDAAMFRGQDDDGYVETKAGGTAACALSRDSYPAGPSTLRIARVGDQVLFRQNQRLFQPSRDRVPTVPLPVRFSAYTHTTPPARPVQIDVDWMLVTQP